MANFLHDVCDKKYCPCLVPLDSVTRVDRPHASFLLQGLPQFNVRLQESPMLGPLQEYPMCRENRFNEVTGYVNPDQRLLSYSHPRYCPPDRHQNVINQDRYSSNAITISQEMRKVAIASKKSKDIEYDHKNTTRMLKLRICETQQWKDELTNILPVLVDATERLEGMKAALQRAVKELDVPMCITRKILNKRRYREGIDDVQDVAEVRMLEEMEIYEKSKSQLCCLIQKSSSIFDLLHSARREIEREISQKDHSLILDTMAKDISFDKSLDLCWGIERIDTSISTKDQWVALTKKNLALAKCAIQKVKTFCTEAEQVIRSTSEEMRDAWNRTQQALKDNIRESEQAKAALLASLHKIRVEMLKLQAEVQDHKAFVHRKDDLRIVHSQIQTRNPRPCLERTHDDVQISLTNEAYDVNFMLSDVQNNIRRLGTALQGLVQTQLNLEHDIQVKSRTLIIDRECLEKRSFYIPEALRNFLS